MQEQDIMHANISNENREMISQSQDPDSAGLTHASDSEDEIDKDEEDV